MREDYRFLDLGDERIFAGLHRPAGAATHGIVICHPMGEEKLWAHRSLVSFARAAARKNVAVLRFDFRGEGDSDRDFERSSVATRIEDTSRAIGALRESVPTVRDVTIVGLRFGASVAAATASQRDDVARLVLWDPVVDGSAYMSGVLRVNLMYQMAIHRRVVETREAIGQRITNGGTANIEGYELGDPLFSEICSFRLHDVLSGFGGETLLVQVNESDAELKPELCALAGGLQRCRVVAAREEPFWRETKSFRQKIPELTQVTLEAIGIAT